MHFGEEFWIKYPYDFGEDGDSWWLVKCSSEEDAKFVLDALIIHCNNFK